MLSVMLENEKIVPRMQRNIHATGGGAHKFYGSLLCWSLDNQDLFYERIGGRIQKEDEMEW